MIAIVTDSTAYLTEIEAQQLGVIVVPIGYVMAGNAYNEDYADKNKGFEKRLYFDAPHNSTSQAPVSAYKKVFTKLLEKDFDILCICISSRLSGTYSCAMTAKTEINSERIAVIDSLTTAGALYLLVKSANEFISQGMSLRTVAAEIKKLRSSVGVSFSVEKIDNLKRSGRMSIVPQSVRTILNIRPIFEVAGGAVTSKGVTRGNREQINKLISEIPQNASEIITHYIEKDNKFELFNAEIKKQFPNAELSERKLGPVLAIHTGAGVIGVSWLI